MSVAAPSSEWLYLCTLGPSGFAFHGVNHMLNEHLEHEINQKFVGDEHLSSQTIGVKAKGGVVTLSGTVRSFRQKLTAQRLAELDNRVDTVINELVVKPPTQLDDLAICSQIDQLFEQSDSVTASTIIVTCFNQSVVLRGYVSGDREKIQAADFAAAVESVVDVSNLLIVNPDEVEANLQHAAVITAAIRNTIGLENESVQLSVVNETARLGGTVDAAWKKEAMEMIARKYKILHVENNILVELH
jgi:osmotically-inducible protein OsmY